MNRILWFFSSAIILLCPAVSGYGQCVVTSTLDPTPSQLSSNPSAYKGTLRYALEVGCGGSSTVKFNIPGTGPHTIVLNSPLEIKRDVVIDGSSQPGYSSEPLVIIDAGNVPNNNYQGTIKNQTGAFFHLGAVKITNIRYKLMESLGNTEIVRCRFEFIGNNVFGYRLEISPSTNFSFVQNIIEYQGNGNADGLYVRYSSQQKVNGIIDENIFKGFNKSVSIFRTTNFTTRDSILILRNEISGDNFPLSSGISINRTNETFIAKNSIKLVQKGVLLESNGNNTVKTNEINLQNGVQGELDLCLHIKESSDNLIEGNLMTYDSMGIVLDSFIENSTRNTVRNRFSKNLFSQLSAASYKPVDIRYRPAGAPGPAGCNQNKRPPEILSASITGSDSVRVTGTSTPGDIIELFQSDATGRNIVKFVRQTITNAGGTWMVVLPITTFINPLNASSGSSISAVGSSNPGDTTCGYQYLAATATDGLNNTSEYAYKYLTLSNGLLADFTCQSLCNRQYQIKGAGSTMANSRYLLQIKDAEENVLFYYDQNTVPDVLFDFPADGSYTIDYAVVLDMAGGAFQCTKTVSKAVRVVNYNLTLSASALDIYCSSNGGGVTLQANGGSAPYLYSIDGVNFTATRTYSGLATGQFKAFVRDSRGCIAQADFKVESLVPIILPQCIPSGACSGPGLPGKLKFIVKEPAGVGSSAASGPNFRVYSYKIINKKTMKVAVSDSSFFERVVSAPVTGLLEGQEYVIEINADNCIVTSGPITIKRPTITVSHQQTRLKCFSDQPTGLEISLNPVFSSCSATPPLPVIKGEIIGTDVTATSVMTGKLVFDELRASSYKLTAVYDTAGYKCEIDFDIPVEAAANLSSTLVKEDIYCRNSPQEKGGRATVYVTGGGAVTYKWYEVSKPNITLSENPSVTNLAPGEYAVKIGDNSNSLCKNPSNPTHVFRIDEIPPVDQPTISTNESDCQISASVRAGVNAAPYTFTWSRNNGFWFHDKVTSWNPSGITSTPSANPAPGIYSVEVKDANGCISRSAPVEFRQDTFPRTYNICIRWRKQEPPPMKEQPPSQNPAVQPVRTLATSIKEDIAKKTVACVERVKSENNYRVEAFCGNAENIDDRLVISYPVRAENYTIYYYDRAGNVVRTVSPNGVKSDIADRTVKPLQHAFVTTYDYNSLGQMVRQSSPDGGVSQFLFNNLGQLRFSQNARQAAITPQQRYSYTKYDSLGRVIESGESVLPANTTFQSLNTISSLQLNPKMPAANNSEQTFVVYNQPAGVSYFGKPQRFLENRISYNWNINLSGDTAYTYYSYDPHGNVEWVAQGIPGFTTNFIGYEYDLISNKVTAVKYNEGYSDRFFHRYRYDEDNRLTLVETSRDGVIWERDAEYRFYAHGPLRQTLLGHDNLQKLDYTYTIHGWLKGINTPDTRESATEGSGKTFARDLFGMELGYYSGDFTRNGSVFNTSTGGSAAWVQRYAKPLYNGNIAYWSTHSSKANPEDPFNQRTATEFYQYDYLNRLRNSTYRLGETIDEPRFATAYTYDAVGNILSLHRNGDRMVQPAMDRMTYHYAAQKNQLEYVTDPVPDAAYQDDIDSQTQGNYVYDPIGNLIRDRQEGLTMRWNLQGKLAEVIPDPGKAKPYIRYTYDPLGNRIKKEVFYKPYNVAGLLELLPDSTRTTYYTLTPDGQTLAIHERNTSALGSGTWEASWKLDALNLYGTDRLGQFKTDSLLTVLRFNAAEFPNLRFIHRNADSTPIYHRFYSKLYELTDHLGNVRTVFSDRRYGDSLDVRGGYAYYPFGAVIPGRRFYIEDYRFGFNGQEKDNDIDENGSHTTAQYWEYDSRLGRRWNIDPVYQVWESGYAANRNNPISYIDPIGNDPLTAGIEGVTAFGIEAGLDFTSQLIEQNGNATKAFDNIKWGAATVEGAKAFTISFFLPPGSQLAVRIAKISKTKMGKLTLALLNNLVTEVAKKSASGEFSTNGSIDLEKIKDIFITSAINTLLDECMFGKAEELYQKLREKNAKLAKKYEKLFEKLEKGKNTDRASSEVDVAQMNVLKTTLEAGKEKTKEEAAKKFAEKFAEELRKEEEKSNENN